MKLSTVLIWLNIVLLGFSGSVLVHRKINSAKKSQVTNQKLIEDKSSIPITPPIPPIVNRITTAIPSYLNYDQTVDQLKRWCEEAPELTEIGTYGKSSAGKDLYFLRIVNKRNYLGANKPKVLMTACIHGNEPLSSSTSMAFFGTMLDQYSKDKAVAELIDSRDIYFIPVVSPDSHPHGRHVDGVDPNRDFPSPTNSNKKSVAPIQALREFFLKIKPNAVISGHTWGRVCLVPWGDRVADCPDSEQYKLVVGKMTQMMGYRYMRACDMYNGNGGVNVQPIRYSSEYSQPIYGSEIDWYYRNGAMAIVMEMGSHQRIPTKEDIKTEFDKTYAGVLHFFKEAPIVSLKSDKNWK